MLVAEYVMSTCSDLSAGTIQRGLVGGQKKKKKHDMSKSNLAAPYFSWIWAVYNGTRASRMPVLGQTSTNTSTTASTTASVCSLAGKTPRGLTNNGQLARDVLLAARLRQERDCAPEIRGIAWAT